MIDPGAKPKISYSNVLYAACIILAIAAVYLYFSEANVDVRRSPKLKGKVERAYLTQYSIPGGGTNKTVTIFAFKLDESPQMLGVYGSSEDYARLVKSVNVGDDVTVYYMPSHRSGVDLDVFQIEKGNAIMLDYEDYRHRSIVLSFYFGGLAVFLFLLARVVVWVRKRRVAE